MLNTITKIKLPGGQEVAFVDWSDKPDYSTCELVHGFQRQEIVLFGYTVGGSVPAATPTAVIPRTATEADTSQEAPGSMASTEERLVYAIRPEIMALTVDEVNQQNQREMDTAHFAVGTGEPVPNPVMLGILNTQLTLALSISRKVYMRAGLGYFNTGFGPMAGSATMGAAAAAGRTYASAGLPSQEAVRTYVVPQYMGGQEKFKLALENPTGAACNFGQSENNAVPTNVNAVARIRVYLDGLYKRPVS